MMRCAGSSELFLNVAQLRIAVSQNQCAEEGVIERAIGRESHRQRAPGTLSKPCQRSGRVLAENPNVVRLSDLHRNQDPLLAIILGPVELTWIHRRSRALKHAKHENSLPGGEPRV